MKGSRMIKQMSLVEAFEIISRARYAARSFSPRPVPKDVIEKILELTQLAPSSFNIQPYKLIVVQSDEAKTKLASAMLGPNQDKVLKAPLSVVFAADKEPSRTIDKLMALEKSHGANPSYISGLPSKITFLLGNGKLSNTFRRLATHIASPLSPAPSISPTNEAWAMKNAALAAQQYMLAATALGLNTAPMEGFDSRRVCYQLNIPEERYCIPMVVSTGYSEISTGYFEISAGYSEKEKEKEKEKEGNINDNDENNDKNDIVGDFSSSQIKMSKKEKSRYPMKEICYLNEFGNPI